MKQILLIVLLLAAIAGTYILGTRQEKEFPATPPETENTQEVVSQEPIVVETGEVTPIESNEPTPVATTEPPVEEIPLHDYAANLPADTPGMVLVGGVVDPRSITPRVLTEVTTESLVNKFNALPEDYAPDNLVSINANGVAKMRLQKPAADAWEAWRQDAEKQGYKVFAVSSYRTGEYQKNLFNRNYKENPSSAILYSAYSRRSEHELGLAVDLSNIFSLPKAGFEETEIGRYLANSAHRFGFILRYPQGKESITQYGFEPWHFRYVGEGMATEIYNQGVTLEEYYGLADASYTYETPMQAEVEPEESPQSDQLLIVTNAFVNVRQKPDVKSEKIGTLHKDDEVIYISEANGWYEIDYENQTGFVAAQYVQKK